MKLTSILSIVLIILIIAIVGTIGWEYVQENKKIEALKQEVTDIYEAQELIEIDSTEFIEVDGKKLAILPRNNIDNILGFYKTHMPVYESVSILIPDPIEFNYLISWLYNNGFVIAKVDEQPEYARGK